jgi:hypothetical protein
VKSIAFTYYSNAVADIFLRNVEKFFYHTGRYDSLVICSDIPIPKPIVSALCEITQVVKISPNRQSISIKKKFSRNENPTIVNPFILTALSYSAASSITVFDPHLFLIKDIDLRNSTNHFFFSQNSLITPSFFKFRPSAEISKLANQFLSIPNYTNESVIQAFNFLVTNSMVFSDKKVQSDLFIFTNPDATIEIKEDKILGFDFLNLSRTPRFNEISRIRDSYIAKNKKQKLCVIKKRHEYFDQSSIASDLADAKISYDNLKLYSGRATSSVKINLIYAKQVANHAKKLENTLRDLGFVVNSSVKPPGSSLDARDPNLHIIMCPNVFTNFPKNYIAYQFEQAHSSWFTDDYINLLNGSIEIWDYSEYNIQHFRGEFTRPHIFVPIGTVEHSIDISNQTRDIDVLFYGEYSRSDRRTEFLTDIKKLRPIRVVDGRNIHMFGSDIVDLLKRTKVVLNHHYYENGQLEVVRVYEALSYGCKVISEVSIDDQFHNLPISKYSTVDEANELITKALDDTSICSFTKDSSHHIKSALSRIGFVFLNSHNTIDNLSKLSIVPRKKKVAVYIHLYYPDLWPELNSYLKNLSEPFDLYVNCVDSTYSRETVYSIVDEYPSAKIFKSNNIGLDVGGLYTCLKYSPAGSSDVSIILHTKKSPHIEDGNSWRNDLISAIIGSQKTAESTIKSIRGEYGVVSSEKRRTTHPDSIGSNLSNLKMLSSRLGYSYSQYPIDFTAGTMFAVKTELLEEIFKTIDYSEFSSGYSIDGTISHAVERLIANYAVHKKYKLKYV